MNTNNNLQKGLSHNGRPFQSFHKMQKRFQLFLFFTLLLIGAGACTSDEIAPENQITQMSPAAKTAFTKKVIRFLGKKPEDASHTNKFDPYFDDQYEKQVENYTLEFFHKATNGKTFFLFTAIAPSIHLKKIAIGGFVQLSKKGDVNKYEELFRTWKQKPAELQPIALVLFNKMVYGESLDQHLTKNSENLGWIEFPNAEVHFDKEKMHWVSTRIDPLDSFYQEKIKQTEEIIKQNKSK